MRGYLVISVYIPPSVSLPDYNTLLVDELSGTLSTRMDKIILAEDFNAKSSTWGSLGVLLSGDKKGLLLTRWAAERDLRIANMGDSPTCVRPQGCSIVDLT